VGLGGKFLIFMLFLNQLTHACDIFGSLLIEEGALGGGHKQLPQLKNVKGQICMTK
jgi:hypothetical protein